MDSAKVPYWLLPKSVAVVGEATRELKQYMVEMVDNERAAHARGDDAGANFMSSLVHASENAGHSGGKDGPSKGGLTDDEIYGNLFVYNIAGHETTANILAYALARLEVGVRKRTQSHHLFLYLLPRGPTGQLANGRFEMRCFCVGF
jgi:cytochrome P450